MQIEFLHIADVHLGYQQYGHSERFNDFGRAFLSAVDYAVEHRMDFVLISGDLFHKSAIDPPTLLQAVGGLDRLRQAEIPVVAVIGNHDRPRYRDRYSWLDFLAERGYLFLLRPAFEKTGIRLPPCNGSEGGYVDIKGVRIYGLPYLGSSIRRVLEELPKALAKQSLEEIEFTVLMGHFGLEGEMPGVPGGLAHNQIALLREFVDYLALGHWHKPFEREGWIYNPGSLETCAMDERRWHGGSYHITVDTKREPKYTAKHIKSRRRPFYRLVFPVDEYTTLETLYDGLRARLEGEGPAMRSSDLAPVVEVSLEGVLAFDRSVLDMEHVRELIEETVSPLIARPRNNTCPIEFEVPSGERLSRAELERQVLQELIRRDSRYRDQAQRWADLMGEVKTMALTGSPPEAIVATMHQRIAGMSEE